MLERLVAARDEWPLCLVEEVNVFGSFARGAVQPGDVDLYIKFRRDQRWADAFADELSYGRDPYRGFRQSLMGRKRGVQFHFSSYDADVPDITPLWRRGDDLEVAVARLHAIKPDPEAGRAPRDAMLPEFDGMDRWLPRFDREHVIAAVHAGALKIERLTLKDARVDHPRALRHLDDRWKPTSPLYRAGRAVFAYWIERGINPAEVHLHGRDVRGGVTPYFAGFSLRYLHAVKRCLTEQEGVEWIEVVHPTARGDLLALRLLPVSKDRLKELPWLRS
jgi:hypothetical protein